MEMADETAIDSTLYGSVKKEAVSKRNDFFKQK